jgi:hypothetical protein
MAINLSIIIGAVDKASAILDKTIGKMGKLGGALEAVQLAADTTKGLNAVGKVAANIGAIVAKGTLALAGVSAAAGAIFKTQLLDTAVEFQGYKTVLETTERSAAGANKALSWIKDFTASTPFEIGQVTEAFTRLRAYGIDPTKGLLKSLGDTSSAMKKPLMAAVEAIADAVTGENERLKEFGIKANKPRGSGNIVYSFVDSLGKQRYAIVNANNQALIQSTLSAIFNEKYKGAMDKYMNTYEGMMSNVGDIITNFKTDIMGTGTDGGLFDYITQKAKALLTFLNENAKNGNLKKWAQGVGEAIKNTFQAIEKGWVNIQPALKQAWEAINKIKDAVGGWDKLVIIIASMATAMFLFNAACSALAPVLAPLIGLIGLAMNALLIYNCVKAVWAFVAAMMAGETAVGALATIMRVSLLANVRAVGLALGALAIPAAVAIGTQLLIEKLIALRKEALETVQTFRGNNPNGTPVVSTVQGGYAITRSDPSGRLGGGIIKQGNSQHNIKLDVDVKNGTVKVKDFISSGGGMLDLGLTRPKMGMA